MSSYFLHDEFWAEDVLKFVHILVSSMKPPNEMVACIMWWSITCCNVKYRWLISSEKHLTGIEVVFYTTNRSNKLSTISLGDDKYFLPHLLLLTMAAVSIIVWLKQLPKDWTITFFQEFIAIVWCGSDFALRKPRCNCCFPSYRIEGFRYLQAVVMMTMSWPRASNARRQQHLVVQKFDVVHDLILLQF